MAAQIKFRDVTLGYDRHPAVHHLHGEVARGALLAVVGPNGAGKSTLFRGLVGILKPLAGSIDLGGLDIRDIAYLPQSVDIDRTFPISVFDLVGTGLWRTTGFFGGMGKPARDKITQALAAVGLNGFENRSIGTLSGGQMQRMLLARVLLQDARLIVLDEPFNAIDAKTSADLLALVRRWHGEGRTVLAALHDMDLVRANFPETLLLARGPVAWALPRKCLRPKTSPRRGGCVKRSTRRPRLRRGRQAAAGRLTVYDALIAPFTEFEFMRRALAAVIALALGALPSVYLLSCARMSPGRDARRMRSCRAPTWSPSPSSGTGRSGCGSRVPRQPRSCRSSGVSIGRSQGRRRRSGSPWCGPACRGGRCTASRRSHSGPTREHGACSARDRGSPGADRVILHSRRAPRGLHLRLVIATRSSAWRQARRHG